MLLPATANAVLVRHIQFSLPIRLICLTCCTFVLCPNAKLCAEDTGTQISMSVVEYPGESFREGVEEMVQRYEYATVSVPRSAEHRAKLVEAYSMLWCFGFVPRDEILSKLTSQANQAIELDPKDAGAQTSMGIAKLIQWEWEAAEKHFAEAVQIDPKKAESLHWYALFLASRGRHEEALQHSQRAIQIDDSPGMITGMGAVLYFGRDWERMVKELPIAIKQDSDFAPAYDWLGMAYVQQKKFPKALETYEKAVSLSGGLAEIVAGLGHAYALAGEKVKAQGILRQLKQWEAQHYVPPVQIAYVHFGLGETDEGFEMLEKAYEQHSWELVFLQVEPWFDSIRNDPRFAQLEKKMNFPRGDQ